MILFVGEIQEIHEDAHGRRAEVTVRGARVEVALDVVPEARVGDSVLVHAGVALQVLRSAEGEEGTPCV